MRDLANRVFAAEDVDLSKADPGCDRCSGSGVVGSVQPTESMRAGGINNSVPMICRCVVRNNGVRTRGMSKAAAIVKQSSNNKELRTALSYYLGLPMSIEARIATLTELEMISYHIDHDKGELIRQIIAETR